MPDASPALSPEELRDRIKVAGVQIPESRLQMVRVLLGNALAPLRALHPAGDTTLEPAVTFTPLGGAHGDR